MKPRRIYLVVRRRFKLHEDPEYTFRSEEPAEQCARTLNEKEEGRVGCTYYDVDGHCIPLFDHAPTDEEPKN